MLDRKAIIIAIALLLVIIVAYVMWTRSKSSATGSATGSSTGSATGTTLTPPAGSKIVVESPDKLSNKGGKWPLVPASCDAAGGYLLLTPKCGKGSQDDLINGGLGTCSDSSGTFTHGSGCVQVRKAYGSA